MTETVRCPWGSIEDPEYSRYHDEEWGVPTTDDRALYEKLCLEGFQSGLSWLTILKKRDNFRKAFAGFDPAKVARLGARDVDRLVGDAGIIRHRGKIEATIANARAVLRLQDEQPLARFLWGYLDGKPLIHHRQSMREVPGQTELSLRISKELKRRGFKFVGPTTVYAFLQSMGFVNDHLVACHRHAVCARLQARFKVPKGG